MPDDFLNQTFSWPDFNIRLLAILFQALPFLLAGAMLSAAVDQFVPPNLLRNMLPTSKTGGVFAALGAGMLFPVCECGMVPVVGRLVRKGVPVSVAATYLIASPLLNPLTLFTTWLAFGGQGGLWMLVGRAGLGGLLCLGIGLWISRIDPAEILKPEVLTGANEISPASALNLYPAVVSPGLRFGRLHLYLHAVVRDFMGVLPFLVVGAISAAFFTTLVTPSQFSHIANKQFFGPIVGVSLSQLLCLCSTTDAFVVVGMGPLPPEGKLAFLIAGPLFDLKLYWVYQSIFQRTFVQALGLFVISGTLLLTWGLGIVLFFILTPAA
ncbi:MAG: permease [Candidatus Methylacidiphilales bacterium]|nr:permease [Candidatus Methylacidiphilales bacterium]